MYIIYIGSISVCVHCAYENQSRSRLVESVHYLRYPMLQGWAFYSVGFRRGPPHGCKSYSLLVPFQENEAEGIVHALCYLFSTDSIVVTRSKRKCRTFQRWADSTTRCCLIRQFWSVRHCVSPFQCLKMIPSSVSIF